MVPGWMLAAIIMTQAPIAATTGGFATEGQVRSAAHRRRVLEAMLPTDSRSPFILTDSGRSNRPLSINLGGFRADGVLDPTGTTVEWPGAGSDQPFDVRATATRLTFHFLASQSLSFSSPPVVKGNTATINRLPRPIAPLSSGGYMQPLAHMHCARG